MALNLKKFLLNALVVPGTVFGIFTLPVALFGSHDVAILYQEEQVFDGEIRHIASPYVALATALSIGVGVINVALKKSWQDNQKISQMEKQLSESQINLKETEKKLEELSLSSPRLLASGLGDFLETEISQEQSLNLTEPEKMSEVKHNDDAYSNRPVEPEIQATKNLNQGNQIELNELQSQLQQIQAQLVRLNNNTNQVQLSESFLGLKVFPSEKELIKNESQFYRQKYENSRNRVPKFSTLVDRATGELEIDIEIALEIMSESGNNKEEVEKVLAQSDRAREWQESLSEEIAQVKISQYIHEVYTLAEELLNWRQLHLLVPTEV